MDVPFSNYFQQMASPMGESLVFFHDNVMFMITFMTMLVFWMMKKTFMNKKFDFNLIHGTSMEILWTLFPIAMLIYMAIPSLKILYAMDDMANPKMTLKCMGHQWYWKYEMNNKTFDSYMVPTSELQTGSFSLLEVDNKPLLPINYETSMISLGGDVIHSFAVPSLAMKSDAMPGSMNQSGFTPNSSGTFYGQCSEICGSDHSFMPINMKVVPVSSYMNWYSLLE